MIGTLNQNHQIPTHVRARLSWICSDEIDAECPVVKAKLAFTLRLCDYNPEHPKYGILACISECYCPNDFQYIPGILMPVSNCKLLLRTVYNGLTGRSTGKRFISTGKRNLTEPNRTVVILHFPYYYFIKNQSFEKLAKGSALGGLFLAINLPIPLLKNLSVKFPHFSWGRIEKNNSFNCFWLDCPNQILAEKVLATISKNTGLLIIGEVVFLLAGGY